MSKKCIITAESTCDVTEQIIKERDFRIIPISVIMGTEEYKDGVNVDTDALFGYVKSTGKLPKTAALTEFEYEDFFNEVKKDCDEIIHFSISSKASSTYFNAVKAAERVGGVRVIDSKTLSGGEGLLMLKASDMLEEGKSVDEVYNRSCELVEKVQCSFVLDVLDYLHKGGRCSSAALVGSKLLKIHPAIHENDGALAVKKKYMGKLEASLVQYVGDLAKEFPNYDKKRVFITHSPFEDRRLVDLMIAKTKELFDFEEVIETDAGATVSTHCGKNCLGVLFIAE